MRCCSKCSCGDLHEHDALWHLALCEAYMVHNSRGVDGCNWPPVGSVTVSYIVISPTLHAEAEPVYVDGLRVILLQVGFLEDWRRANVALSRARAALVVVGHKSTLKGSKTWGAFLRHVDDRGCLVKLNHLQDVLASAARPQSNGRRR